MFAAIVEVVAMLMFIVFCIVAILLYAIRRTQSVKYKSDVILREYYKDLKKKNKNK